MIVALLLSAAGLLLVPGQAWAQCRCKKLINTLVATFFVCAQRALSVVAAPLIATVMVAVLFGSPAIADCNQVGTVVTCSGVTTNTAIQNGAFEVGYRLPSQSNLTVNVQPGASVSGDINGIISYGANDNTALNNYGTITTTGANALSASAVTLNDHNAVITNYGTIAGTGTFLGDGINLQVQNTTQPTTIINYGTISGLSGIDGTSGSGSIVNVTNFGTIAATADPHNRSNAIGGYSSIVTNELGGIIDGKLEFLGSGSTVNNSGLITITAPGLAVGSSHNIGGSFTQTSSGNLTLRVNSSANDAMSITSTATLAGTLTVVAASSTFKAKYTLLTALGGISGTFSNLVTNGSWGSLSPRVSYDATNVYLMTSLLGSLPTNASDNQRGLSRGIDNAIANGVTLLICPL